MKPDRTPCCVPFCKRTAKKSESDEVICGAHGRLIDKDLKAKWRNLSREVDNAMQRPPEAYDGTERLRVVADFRRCEELWGQMKRQAIERAVGVS